MRGFENRHGKPKVKTKVLIAFVTAVVTVGATSFKRLEGTESGGHVVGRLQVKSLDTKLSVS